jgi:hypothetical protein
MRGRDENRLRIEAVYNQPLPVHGLWHDLHPHCADALGLSWERRILNCDARSAARPEYAQQKIDALRRPLDDHDLGRVSDHSPSAAQVVSESSAKDALATRLAVVERGGT